MHGKTCLADFKTLVAGSSGRKETNIAPARLPSIGEDNDMDLGGFQLEETDKDKAIARKSKLRRLADVLAGCMVRRLRFRPGHWHRRAHHTTRNT